MGSRLALVLLLLLCGLRTARAKDLDVLPQETIVPQCTTLTALWSQTPPIHLHVQPDDSITITNLFDLGVQNGSFTTFQVALPIGQNFSFAYNTLADPFTVFQSSVMQVGPGSPDCVVTPAPNIPEPTSNTFSTSLISVNTSTSTPTSTSNSATSPPATAVSPVAASSGSSRPAFPVGAAVGIICAGASILLIGLAVFWRVHRRTMQRLASPYPDPERPTPSASAPAPKFLAPGRRGLSYKAGASMREMAREDSFSAGTRDDDIGLPGATHEITVDIPNPKSRRLVLNSPMTPTTATEAPSPRVHTDAGVRIRHPEELPPLYRDYNRS